MRLPIRIAAWTTLLAFAAAPAVTARPAQEPQRLEVANAVMAGGSFANPGKVEARFASTAFAVITPDSLGGAQYWYEYGTTIAYGSRTRTATIPAAHRFRATVRATSGPLEYEREYHYRLVVQTPEGVFAGRDATFTARHTQLRPRARVLFNWRDPGTRHLLVTVTVLDAPGNVASVSNCAPKAQLCLPIIRRALGRSAVLARDLDVPYGRTVGVSTGRERRVSQTRGERRSTLLTTFRAGKRPVTREKCIGDVLLPGGLGDDGFDRCINVRAVEVDGRITSAAVVDAVRGTRVEVICRGPGCARRREVHVARGGTFRRPYRNVRLKRLTRVRTGATIDVYITRPGSLGLYRRMKLTSETLERGPYRCIAAGSKRRIAPCR